MDAAQKLFAWPKQAHFGRVLNKERFYAGARNNRKLKQLFTEQVSRMTWQYKLATETLNIPSTPEVPEIEVIQIEAKTAELDEAILQAIDRAIPNPTIHEIHSDDRTCQMAAFKRPSEADKSAKVISHYVSTSWQPRKSDRSPLPVTLNLSKLYSAIFRGMIDIPDREGESLKLHVERHAEVLAARREAERIAKKMNTEKQFNRKVDLNGQLRKINEQIQALTRTKPQEADG
ncbi:DUF4391 domain-containing protein [Roseimaritima sediminicola]|uniref:DUF4391 domain-containing protein n=1 Tax=Roseimaritima sediminicola TaxID=2662066 RepID=UPI00129830C1|nr:DUF4391 domain-containing protein [Roseimaritima sediminicola]